MDWRDQAAKCSGKRHRVGEVLARVVCSRQPGNGRTTSNTTESLIRVSWSRERHLKSENGTKLRESSPMSYNQNN
jgi:hypothetical protein